MLRMLKKLLRNDDKAPLLFNEAINFDLKCIYIAIPKTGSTSVRKLVAPRGKFFLPGPHLSATQVSESLYAYYLHINRKQNTEIPSSEVPSNEDVRAQAQLTFDDFFKFSVVRNPWARAVSLYNRREGLQPKEIMSFDEFIEKHIFASDTCRWPTLHKNQLDWISDCNGKVLVDYFCKIEEFPTHKKEIYDLTNGRLNLSLGRHNHNAKSNSDNYRQMYNKHTSSLVEKHFEVDIETFKYLF